MATHVRESIVVQAPISEVWNRVKTLNFSFVGNVKSITLEKGTHESTVGALRTIDYNDGITQQVRLRELSEQHHFITWEVEVSIPKADYDAVTHTVRLWRISDRNQTFVEYTSDYSKNIDLQVMLDSKYKKLDFFRALRLLVESRAATFLKSLDFGSLKSLTAAQVEDAWKEFDTDRNGVLDRNEIEKLIESFLTRISEEQHTVQEALVNMFQEADEKGVKEVVVLPDTDATFVTNETSTSAKGDHKAAPPQAHKAGEKKSEGKDEKAAASAPVAAVATKVEASAAKGGKDHGHHGHAHKDHPKEKKDAFTKHTEKREPHRRSRKHGEEPTKHERLSRNVVKDLKKRTSTLARELIGRMDVNKDGKIDKSEFTVLFPAWFERKILEGIRGSYF